MKFKHFIPPFYQHNPAALEQGDITAMTELWAKNFTSMYYLMREEKKVLGFSFQVNECAPTATIVNPATHLLNVDMDGGRSFVIGHLWMSKEEADWNKEFLDKKHPINEVYTGNETMFQPVVASNDEVKQIENAQTDVQ